MSEACFKFALIWSCNHEVKRVIMEQFANEYLRCSLIRLTSGHDIHKVDMVCCFVAINRIYLLTMFAPLHIDQLYISAFLQLTIQGSKYNCKLADCKLVLIQN